ncbi:MAG: hypothetical protein CMP61_11805 [Flavobacteriales bacterium]|nr:hypothetical protein [Flavobacteriales bacterium]|tara:strand:- start:10398 stop:11471 length:1074 start_codon:yes stop_codon:yes gene_type:complete
MINIKSLMFHKITIKNINKETPEAVSIEFDIPENLKDEFSFKPGQFLTLKAKIQDKDVKRSYSLCSSPSSGQHKVVVKQIPNGMFSSFANQELKISDTLEVNKPAGSFYIETAPSNNKNYTLLAAGSGITPMMSILKTVLKEEPNSTVNLFYGNKNPELTIFKEELEQIKINYGNRFNLHFVYSRSKGESRFHTGRLEGRKLNKLFKKFAPISHTDDIFICGPETLTMNVKELLINKFKFDPSNIHFELFTTSTPIVPKKNSKSEGISEVKATINGEVVNFSVKKNQSILEGGLAAGFDVPFSCQGGVCGVCRCMKGNGEVEMENNLVLSEEEIESGAILACQSRVLSDHIEVIFNE